MKRAGLLFCADVDAPRFKLLKQRDQLPFHVPAHDGAEKWTDYTLDQAFRLRLMLDLIGGEGEGQLAGIGPNDAVKLVSNALGYFPRHPLDVVSEQDLWVGVAVFEEATSEGSHRFTRWFAGDLAELPSWLAKAGTETDGKTKLPVVRIFMANASRAAKFVRDRAQGRGLPEASEFSEVRG